MEGPLIVNRKIVICEGLVIGGEWLDGWMVGWLDDWMVGWLAGWLDGWMAGWKDGFRLRGLREVGSRLGRVSRVTNPRRAGFVH